MRNLFAVIAFVLTLTGCAGYPVYVNGIQIYAGE